MKFWTETDIPWLTSEREKKFKPDGADNEMFLHIGFFVSCYALVELRLTVLLAKATKISNLHSFDLLTRGMDVRVKIERLRRACERGFPIGPNLNARLSILDSVMRPLRNQIVHSATVPSPDKLSISFAGLAAMPSHLPNRHPDQDISEAMTILDLFEYCAWLRFFNVDLKEAHRGLVQRGMFETDPPHAPLLRKLDQPPGQPKPAATSSRRERKRLRKGGQLRGERK